MMIFARSRFSFAFILVLISACAEESTLDYQWDLPPNFPAPKVPQVNPMTFAKVELGRHLFYDSDLSLNQTQSCASCHHQDKAFTDALALSPGSTGELTARSSMSLVNVAYTPSLTWANPTLHTIEAQALIPLFGEAPVELGFSGKEDTLLDRIQNKAEYQGLFPDAFSDESAPFTIANIAKALGAFQRSIISADSNYDRYQNGDSSALNESEKRGMELFFGEKLECFHCHGGFNLSAAVDHQGNVFDQSSFQNNGLYNIGGRGDYPANNQGLYEFTQKDKDKGKFRPPTLRNIALTAPYMHDGSITTLEEVVDHYAAGGRVIRDGAHKGDGRQNPNKSIFVQGFELNAQEKADLIAFLRALTDESIATNPDFNDPW